MNEPTDVFRAREGGVARSLSPELLPSVVGFSIAFRTITVLLAVRIFGADPEMGTAANVGLGFLLLGIATFCTLADPRQKLVPMLQLPIVRWILLFLGFSCCSLLWSTTVSLPNASLYWCAMASDVATVAMLLQARSLDHPAEALMQGYVWGACAVAMIAWIMPAESDLRLGDEDLLGPNQIGYVCALGFYFAQYLLRKIPRGSLLAAVFLAVTLLRSLSKTTIVAFLISEGFLLARDRSISRKTKALVSLAVVVVIATFSSLMASYYDVYTNAGNQSETLSGRLGIWAYFFAEAIQQPWVGHGFDSAWKVIPPFGADQFQAAHAHNELLQQFYAYGVVGIILFCGIYGSVFLQVRRLAIGRERTFFLALLLFVLVRGLADADRFDLSLPVWSALIIAWLMETVRMRAAESREADDRLYNRRKSTGPCAPDPTGLTY